MNTEAKLYVCDADALTDETLFDMAYKRMSAYRKAKVDRYRLKSDKRLSMCVELLLMNALEREGMDKTIEYSFNEFGKPYLKDKNVFFSLSHSDHYALCVVSDTEIGCDIEKIKDDSNNIKIAERFFDKSEYGFIKNAPEETRNAVFCRIWTLKESYIKMTGQGMSLPLDSFIMIPDKVCPDGISVFETDIPQDCRIAACAKGKCAFSGIWTIDIRQIIR